MEGNLLIDDDEDALFNLNIIDSKCLKYSLRSIMLYLEFSSVIFNPV